MNARILAVAALVAACGRGGTVPGPLPVKEPQPLTGCAGKSVLAIEGAALERLGADGSSTLLFHFGEGRPDDQVSVEDWQENNGFIAVLALLFTANGGDIDNYEYVVMDPQGQLVFHLLKQQQFTGPVRLGSDGTLAVAGTTGWLAHPDGSTTDLGALLPLDAVLPGGLLPVARGYPWDPASEKGLLALDTMTFTALSPKPDDSSTFVEVAGSLLYVAGGKLVLVSATGTQQVALPDASLAIGQVAGDRFVTLSSGTGFVVLDTATLHTTPVTNLPEPTERQSVSISLGDDGTVFSTVPDNDLLQLRRSIDFGATWQDVGAPMAKGADFGGGAWLSPLARNGNVLIISGTTGYGLFFNSLQLVTQGPSQSLDMRGLYGVSAHPGADLSADGQCAAAWVQVSTDTTPQFELHFVDAQHGDAKVLTKSQLPWFRF